MCNLYLVHVRPTGSQLVHTCMHFHASHKRTRSRMHLLASACKNAWSLFKIRIASRRMHFVVSKCMQVDCNGMAICIQLDVHNKCGQLAILARMQCARTCECMKTRTQLLSYVSIVEHAIVRQCLTFFSEVQ